MHTIRSLRESKQWTQADLAYRLGVAPSTIYNWETGKAEPRLSQFKAIAVMFGVSMDDIEIPAVESVKKLVAA